jgi:iron(III) transport system substrate-binding protein
MNMRWGNLGHVSRSLAALAILAAGGIGAAQAQSADTVDMAAAKKEGKVVWYTSTPMNQAAAIAKAFEAEMGVKVELFRSGGSAVMSRFLQEATAGRIAADVMTTSDPAAYAALARKKTFVAFRPKNFDKVPKEAQAPDGAYVAQRINIMTIYLRTDKVAPADVPKTWAELVEPKYSGKLVMTDPSFTSLQVSVVGMMSKEVGWDYYKKLHDNKIMIVQGNEQVSDMIKRAERVIAVGALDSYAAEDRKSGHPITTVFPSDGVFLIPSPTAVIAGSPNPNAAKLLAEFMLSDTAQKIFPASGGYAARIDIAPPAGGQPLNDMKIRPVDYDYIGKETQRIKRQFNEIFQ